MNCPFCGFVYDNGPYKNIYGKFCTKCNNYIEPNRKNEPKAIKMNRLIKENLKRQCLERLRKKIKKEM